LTSGKPAALAKLRAAWREASREERGAFRKEIERRGRKGEED
jgi:hypothetical protein